MTKNSQNDRRILPFPLRGPRPTAPQMIAATTKGARRHAVAVGTVGLVLFALATALMTAVIPLILFGAFLAWCGLMALLTAIDVIPDRLGLKNLKKEAARLRGPINHRAMG